MMADSGASAFSFWIPGEPVAKGRPRKGRNGQMFTPKATRDWESTAAMKIASAANLVRFRATKGEFLWVKIDAFFARTKADEKKGKWPMLKGTGKDADNIAKAVCDALQKSGVIFNDSQICRLGVVKYYETPSEKAGVGAVVQKIEQEEWR